VETVWNINNTLSRQLRLDPEADSECEEGNGWRRGQ